MKTRQLQVEGEENTEEIQQPVEDEESTEEIQQPVEDEENTKEIQQLPVEGKENACVHYIKHITPTLYMYLKFINNIKAKYLFQKTPCSPCGTILFRTKPICSKCMHRLVTICVNYTSGRRNISY